MRLERRICTMTAKKAKGLLHGVVLTMWAQKQMKKDGLDVKPIGKYITEVSKRRNSLRKGIVLMLIGIVLLFVTAYFCVSKDPQTSPIALALAIADVFLVFATIARGAWLCLIEQIPEADEVVKRLVAEYFELHTLLSKGDLWGDYIRDAIEDGTLCPNLECWSSFKLEKLPRTLVDEAETTLLRLGKRVARLGGNKPSSSRGANLKTKKLIPAFRAAVQVGATHSGDGYGRYIPESKDSD